MGVDFLDFQFRLEKRLGIKLPNEGPTWQRFMLEPWKTTGDITAGDLHDYVCEICRTQGKPVPWSSWGHVKIALHGSLGVSPAKIRRSSRLIADLGMD